MKKIIKGSVLFIVIASVGFYLYVKFNPPLEVNTLAWSDDKKSVVVSVGNKGLREFRIVDVVVNNDEEPNNKKLQVRNLVDGIIIMNNFDSDKAKQNGFMKIDGVAIKEGTSAATTFEKLDNGSATKDDLLYGVSVLHDEEVSKVHIKYSYFGIPFNRTVTIN